eukprot:3938277-Rhodomonas_salina.1
MTTNSSTSIIFCLTLRPQTAKVTRGARQFSERAVPVHSVVWSHHASPPSAVPCPEHRHASHHA